MSGSGGMSRYGGQRAMPDPMQAQQPAQQAPRFNPMQRPSGQPPGLLGAPQGRPSGMLPRPMQGNMGRPSMMPQRPAQTYDTTPQYPVATPGVNIDPNDPMPDVVRNSTNAEQWTPQQFQQYHDWMKRNAYYQYGQQYGNMGGYDRVKQEQAAGNGTPLAGFDYRRSLLG